MSHALKILLNILHTRIFKKLEENFRGTQWFWKRYTDERGTFWNTGTVSESMLCYLKYLRILSISTKYNTRILRESNIDVKSIRLIVSLHKNQ